MTKPASQTAVHSLSAKFSLPTHNAKNAPTCFGISRNKHNIHGRPLCP